MGSEHHRPPVDRQWVEKAATLSRLRLCEEEITEILPQLEQILDHVDQLRSVATDGVEPFTHPLFELLPGSEAHALRRDEPFVGASPRTLLEQAPERVEDSFQVPQAAVRSGRGGA